MKKGFTLIELLAVIVILAILALIVSPIISGVISDAKDASNKRSVEGLAKSAEYYVMKQKYANEEVSEENIYNKLTFSGKKPDSAEVYTKNNKVAVAAIFEDRCYYKNYDSNEVKSSKLSESRVCTINGAETDESCFTYNLINNDTNVEITDYVCSYEAGFTDAYKKTNADLILEAPVNYYNSYDLKEDEIITDVVIPGKIDNKKVTTIGDYAFSGNYLTSVIIPNSVTTIGDRAFSGNNLTSAVIPNSVTTIGEYAFFNNDLTSVIIPNSVTSIGLGAFSSNNLTSAVIPNSVTTIGDYAFSYNDLNSVIIPNSVTTIGEGAFCFNQLTSVVIPDSVISIRNSAFSINNLTSVVIPSGVTSIGKSAFSKNSSSNTNLTTITNKTGKSFDWGLIVNASTGYNFTTGTVVNSTGNVTIN